MVTLNSNPHIAARVILHVCHQELTALLRAYRAQSIFHFANRVSQLGIVLRRFWAAEYRSFVFDLVLAVL